MKSKKSIKVTLSVESGGEVRKLHKIFSPPEDLDDIIEAWIRDAGTRELLISARELGAREA